MPNSLRPEALLVSVVIGISILGTVLFLLFGKYPIVEEASSLEEIEEKIRKTQKTFIQYCLSIPVANVIVWAIYGDRFFSYPISFAAVGVNLLFIFLVMGLPCKILYLLRKKRQSLLRARSD